MKRIFPILLFLLLSTILNSYNKTVEFCLNCLPPENVTITGETAISATFSWNCVPDANEYILAYELAGHGQSAPIYVQGTSYTFTGLSAGIYTFYFSSICGGETSTSWVIIEDINI